MDKVQGENRRVQGWRNAQGTGKSDVKGKGPLSDFFFLILLIIIIIIIIKKLKENLSTTNLCLNIYMYIQIYSISY